MTARVKVSPFIVGVAAAGYMLLAELECPAPDFVMRREYQRRLSDAVQALTVEERKWLKARVAP